MRKKETLRKSIQSLAGCRFTSFTLNHSSKACFYASQSTTNVDSELAEWVREHIAPLPNNAPLGAEIKGVSIPSLLAGVSSSQSSSRLLTSAISKAISDNCILLIRDQHNLTERDQVEFTRTFFGPPVPHTRRQSHSPTTPSAAPSTTKMEEDKLPEIFIISNKVREGLGAELIPFHTDLSYRTAPSSFSILHALELPPEGGDTCWINCYKAYEALDADTKKRIANLRAVHRHPVPYMNELEPIPVVHPVVRTHPETRRKLIYVNPHFTSHILDLSAEESDKLLAKLYSHTQQERFVYTHRWRVGDVMVWDNRCTQHKRLPFDHSYTRIMKRTQVAGTPTY